MTNDSFLWSLDPPGIQSIPYELCFFSELFGLSELREYPKVPKGPKVPKVPNVLTVPPQVPFGFWGLLGSYQLPLLGTPLSELDNRSSSLPLSAPTVGSPLSANFSHPFFCTHRFNTCSLDTRASLCQRLSFGSSNFQHPAFSTPCLAQHLSSSLLFPHPSRAHLSSLAILFRQLSLSTLSLWPFSGGRLSPPLSVHLSWHTSSVPPFRHLSSFTLFPGLLSVQLSRCLYDSRLNRETEPSQKRLKQFEHPRVKGVYQEPFCRHCVLA